MDKIIGLGNALVDVLATLTEDELLHRLGLPKGSMTLIDADRRKLLQFYLDKLAPRLVTGGSAANAMAGLAGLGAPVGFVGKVGLDEYGRFFTDSMRRQGVDVHLFVDDQLPSGIASTFISPDGERTFGTYLGAASALTADDLSLDLFQGYSYLFVEGYLVQDHALLLRALQLAKEAGLQICLDLASYNIVKEERDFFSALLKEYVDVVFANAEEARAFAGCEPREALQVLSALCDMTVVKLGADGSLLKKGTELVHVPAVLPERVIDTTGAGDYFAAGFLYGCLCNCSLDKCGAIGSLLSAQVIATVGTKLLPEQWLPVRQAVRRLVEG